MQLLLQERDEKGVFLGAFLQGFHGFQAHFHEIIIILRVLEARKRCQGLRK